MLGKDIKLAKRYKTDITFDVVRDDGENYSVNAVEISRAGIWISCNHELANKIEPLGIQNNILNKTRLKVIAKLPSNTSEKLYARSLISSVRRLSQNVYLIGLKFYDFEYGSEKILYEFIAGLQSGKKFENEEKPHGSKVLPIR